MFKKLREWWNKLGVPKWESKYCPLCYIPEDGSYLFHNPKIIYSKDQLCSKHLKLHDPESK